MRYNEWKFIHNSMEKLVKKNWGELMTAMWTKLKRPGRSSYWKTSKWKTCMHIGVKKLHGFQPKAGKEMLPHLTLTGGEIWTVLRHLKNSQMVQKNTCLLRLSHAYQILFSAKHFCHVINNLWHLYFFKPLWEKQTKRDSKFRLTANRSELCCQFHKGCHATDNFKSSLITSYTWLQWI